MSIREINTDQCDIWNQLVRSFTGYDVFYLCEYVRAFQYHGDGNPILLYFNNGKTRALNVVMKRDIAKDTHFKGLLPLETYYDISTPYGYGGFIIEGEDYEEVNRAYEEYCIEHGIISEFVRFSLFNGYEKVYGGEVETRTRNIVRSLDMNPEEMLMDFEHKVRKNLKKARANNLRIEIDEKGEKLPEFLNVYYKTMDRNNATTMYYFKDEFFKILNTMKDNIVYFNVYDDNVIISTELVIYSEDYCYSYLGGTLEEYFDLRPNEFLKYEIIKWAYEKELKYFVLGGGYGEDDGIFKYKKSFAPKGIKEFYIGKKIFDSKKFDYLVGIREKSGDFNSHTEFFPKYRG